MPRKIITDQLRNYPAAKAGAFNAAMRLDDIATLNASLGNRLPRLRNLLP